MKRVTTKRVAAIMMLIIMLVSVMAPNAFAYEAMDMNQPTSLTVKFTDGPAVPGMEFRAYRIAAVDENVNFTFTDAIASYGVTMPEDQSGYRMLAETLSGYISRDGVTATATAVTDENGIAEFGELEKGLYLVLADRYMSPVDKMSYTAAPSLVALPNSTDGNTWIYDVVISPKSTSVPHTPGTPGETVDINVIKIWTGEANKDKRPTEIVAELICEGQVMDAVTLNSDNNWRHTWKELDKEKSYSVTEREVPTGYTVTITRDGNTFTINNFSGDVPPVVPPRTPELPRTGQLWWPVPILAGAGLIFITAGTLRKRAAEA